MHFFKRQNASTIYYFNQPPLPCIIMYNEENRWNGKESKEMRRLSFTWLHPHSPPIPIIFAPSLHNPPPPKINACMHDTEIPVPSLLPITPRILNQYQIPLARCSFVQCNRWCENLTAFALRKQNWSAILITMWKCVIAAFCAFFF